MKTIFLKLFALVLIFAMLLPLGSGIGAKESSQRVSSEALPKVELFTESGKAVTTKTYEDASLIMTLSDRFAQYTNEYTSQEGGNIEIRCRGNSSFDVNHLGGSGKFSYKIKLENKADLLGMGESRHWVLIANYFDVTSLRNKFAYDLSGAMGLTFTQSRWVVVYLNGKYQGLYTLCESIRIADGRVDITDWEERAEAVAGRIADAEGLSEVAETVLAEEMKKNFRWVTDGEFRGYQIADYCDPAELNIDSGYLLEYDVRQDGDTSKFTTKQGIKIQLDSPTELDTNREMFYYVIELLDDMEEAFWSETFCTEDGIHYSEFVDMQSLVDYFILFYLFKNIEFGHLSIFLYIEGGKIYFGPAWDFDGASGNPVTLTDDWMIAEKWFYMDGRAPWWKELCGDPYFVTRVEERWQEIRPLVDLYMESLPVWKAYIQSEAEQNFTHFGGPKDWYRNDRRVSFEAEYDTLVNWMERRIAWLDEQWSLRDPDMESRGLVSSDRLFMNLRYADGKALAKDLLTISGAKSDRLYDLSRQDDLQLTVNTQHTTHQKVFVYVNGKFVDEAPLNLETAAQVTIPRQMLDVSQGAVNVIYIVGFNGTDYYRASYLTVRMAEVVPTGLQCVVRVGNDYFVADKDDSIVLPEINVHADGFRVLGWTDGENVFQPGAELIVSRSANLWIDWEREDLLGEFYMKDGKQVAVLTPTPVLPQGQDENVTKNYIWILALVVPVSVAGISGGIWYINQRKRKRR